MRLLGAYLELPAIDPPTYPAVEDREAWLAMIEQRDRSIAQRFTDDGLAVTSEKREVAGSGMMRRARTASPTLTRHRSISTCMAVG